MVPIHSVAELKQTFRMKQSKNSYLLLKPHLLYCFIITWVTQGLKISTTLICLSQPKRFCKPSVSTPGNVQLNHCRLQNLPNRTAIPVNTYAVSNTTLSVTSIFTHPYPRYVMPRNFIFVQRFRWDQYHTGLAAFFLHLRQRYFTSVVHMYAIFVATNNYIEMSNCTVFKSRQVFKRKFHSANNGILKVVVEFLKIRFGIDV